MFTQENGESVSMVVAAVLGGAIMVILSAIAHDIRLVTTPSRDGAQARDATHAEDREDKDQDQDQDVC